MLDISHIYIMAFGAYNFPKALERVEAAIAKLEAMPVDREFRVTEILFDKEQS